MLLRPLFFTSFLIDDQLADEGLTERGPIVISSASSKTAIAAAFLLARREGVELVGLTSPRSAEFVEGLGIYGRVRHLRRRSTPSAAGPPPTSTSPATATVRRAVHSHYGDELVHSMAVGVTHWEELGRRRGRAARADAGLLLRSRPSRQALRGLGPRRPRATRRRRLAPVLRVDRRLARGDPRPGLRGSPERLPRRARGPASTRRTPTCSPSARGNFPFPGPARL